MTAETIRPRALDVRGAAAFLSLSETTVRRLVRSGELPHVRIGRAVRLREEDLELYLEKKRTTSWKGHGGRPPAERGG